MKKPNHKNYYRLTETLIIKSFSKFVNTYERHAALQKTMAERLAVLIDGDSVNTIIEIGCGTGLFTRHLLTLPFKKLILNDLAEEMVNRLKKQINLPMNTLLCVGNAEQLIFPQTDLIASNAVFQWFQDPEKTLRRFAGFLNPGGKLVFSAFGPKTLTELRQISEVDSPTNLLTQSRWKKIITKSGLRMIKAESEMRKIIFPSALALIKNLQQSGTAPIRLLQTGRLRKVIRQYDSMFSSYQGVYSNWEMYYFRAQKFNN